MKTGFRFLAFAIPIAILAQNPGSPPHFDDFPAGKIYQGAPARPALTTPDERRFRTTISLGVTKGFSVEDGSTGKELTSPGPNFAGHYALVTWGCGSPCLMVAIVDLITGRVFPPPFHHGPGRSYFQLPWAFPAEPPLAYRVDSNLLVANICESDKAQTCGTYYFLMGDKGLTLIRKVREK